MFTKVLPKNFSSFLKNIPHKFHRVIFLFLVFNKLDILSDILPKMSSLEGDPQNLSKIPPSSNIPQKFKASSMESSSNCYENSPNDPSRNYSEDSYRFFFQVFLQKFSWSFFITFPNDTEIPLETVAQIFPIFTSKISPRELGKLKKCIRRLLHKLFLEILQWQLLRYCPIILLKIPPENSFRMNSFPCTSLIFAR